MWRSRANCNRSNGFPLIVVIVAAMVIWGFAAERVLGTTQPAACISTTTTPEAC